MSKSTTYLLLGSLFLFLACTSQEKKSDRIILKLSPHFQETDYGDDRKEIAAFLEDYLNLMFDSSISKRNSYWQSNILYSKFDRFLKIGKAKSYMTDHPPQLLGIRKLENERFCAKLAFYRDEYPEEIMELILAKDGLGKYYFIEGLGERVKSFEKRESGKLEFYYSSECKIDSLEEQKVLDYNLLLSNYFNSQERSLRIIVCENLEDYAELLGIDYATFLNLDLQTGGRALPDEDLYISANGSPYYPHELVHIYTSQLNPHPFMDEGMATYLGGSGGIALQDHLETIAPKRDSFDFSNLLEDQYLYQGFQASYLIGGMLLKLADEEYGGKDSVISLLSTGREDEELMQSILEVFELSEEEVDAFIKAELANYLPEEV